MIHNRQHILNSLYRMFLYYLFSLFLFFTFRLFYLISFGKARDFFGNSEYIKPVLFTSIRYDNTVMAYVLIPVFLSILIGVFFDDKSKFMALTDLFSKKYYVFALFLLLIITSLDFFFFKTYGHHFSTIIFGIKDDDTSAIITTLWGDYPVIKLLLFWGISFIFLKHSIYKINQKKFLYQTKPYQYILLLIVVSVLYFIAMRGSFASHGLDLRHASVTDNQFLNQLTINPVFALKEAISKSEENKLNLNYKKSLTANGFQSYNKALQTYLSDEEIDTLHVEKSLFTKTPINDSLAEKPLNVVFILMESFSRHLFDLHSSQCNLLGDLEQELPYCYVFENSLSSRNLTIHSLENILTGTPYTPIAQSPYNNIPLKTSIVFPFRKSGYTSAFIYGGLYGWRNIGNYMKTQGFDKVITQKKLERAYPDAAKFAWGLHDAYLYKKAWKLLQSAEKPQFLFLLTLSNHTPYDLPEDYKPKPIQFPDSLYKKMRMEKDIVTKNLKAFQYANEQLGRFIHKIRNSNLGQNTLIVITGDHNLHRGFTYTEKEIFLAHSVPIIIYIPEKYRYKYKVNPNTFASHKDIFPTIYNLSLSNAEYFNTGKNLLENPYNFSVNDFTFAADKYGAVKIGNPIQFYQWEDSTKLYLKKSQSNVHLNNLLRRLKAYKAVMGYTIQKDLSSKKNNEQTNTTY